MHSEAQTASQAPAVGAEESTIRRAPGYLPSYQGGATPWREMRAQTVLVWCGTVLPGQG